MPPVIELSDITKTYSNGKVVVRALRGVNLEIAEGEFIAVMGSSGSGKSTLMNILGCLDVQTGGRYLLDGIDINGLGTDEKAEIRSSKIGFVFQSFNLLARTTAIENVELPLVYMNVAGAERKKLAGEALGLVGLAEREDHLPNQLSGGQQQRVAIARAVVNDPRIILADEPTGNLDTATSYEIMGLFRDLNDRGKTIVMITHEEDIAAHCKRIISVKDGEITEDRPNAAPRNPERSRQSETIGPDTS